MESSGKRVRAAGGGDTASAEAPDRVTLHVGGETFVTCRATLEPASSYFARRFCAEWSSGVPSDDCFLDRDADSFRVLLSFMRCGHVSVLPRDPALFSRVLLDAEYFGIDSLIEQVKVKVQRHLHSNYRQTRFGLLTLSGAGLASVEARWTAAAFDEEHGGLREAIDTPWLVDRFFKPKPSHCSKILQLLPARKTDTGSSSVTHRINKFMVITAAAACTRLLWSSKVGAHTMSCPWWQPIAMTPITVMEPVMTMLTSTRVWGLWISSRTCPRPRPTAGSWLVGMTAR